MPMPTEEQTYRRNTEEKLDAILDQVRRTNGRVGRLENWRWMITGAIAVLTALVIPLLFTLVEASHIIG